MNKVVWHAKRHVLLFLVLALASTWGCGARRPPFEPITSVPEGRVLVFIYRPSGFLARGLEYDLHANDDRVVTVLNGGYFPYLALPGETEFWARTEAKSSITTDLKEGQTYYLRAGVSVGILMGRPKLNIVDESVGSREVRKCTLLPGD